MPGFRVDGNDLLAVIGAVREAARSGIPIIVLDLKQPAGHAALARLLERADVMIWNNRPQSMARMKLSYDDVRRINPRIVYCGLFGFGQGGRYRDKPAYDTIIQGVGGMAALNHITTGEPRFVPMVVADKVVGLIAVQMIAMALYGRARTGQGSSIEIPMFENLAKFVLEEHMYLKTFEPPLGGAGDPRILDASNRPIPTRDGWICMSANTDAQAFAFFDAPDGYEAELAATSGDERIDATEAGTSIKDNLRLYAKEINPRSASSRATGTIGGNLRASFVAAGDAVFVSADGAVWRERTATPGRANSFGLAASVGRCTGKVLGCESIARK